MRGLWACWIAIAACDGPGEDGGRPRVQILSPLENSTVCGTPLRVEVVVENFELVPLDVASTPGAGHVDFSVNGQPLTMTEETSFDVPDLEDGLYQLQAELVLADHTSLEPYTGHTIYTTIASAACTE